MCGVDESICVCRRCRRAFQLQPFNGATAPLPRDQNQNLKSNLSRSDELSNNSGSPPQKALQHCVTRDLSLFILFHFRQDNKMTNPAKLNSKENHNTLHNFSTRRRRHLECARAAVSAHCACAARDPRHNGGSRVARSPNRSDYYWRRGVFYAQRPGSLRTAVMIQCSIS